MALFPPNLLNDQDRLQQVAHLLALGILRHKARLTHQKEADNPTNSLDFRVFPSVHAHDVTLKKPGVSNES